jgi:hypothetical protein
VINSILLDIPPDPVGGIGALMALGILIVGIVTVLVVALVFVLFWLKRRKAKPVSGGNVVVQPISPNQ